MKRLYFTLIVIFLGLASFAAMPVIDPELEAEMQRIGNEEQIEVIVLMKEQYDRSQLSRRADYYPSHAERRAFVVNELKSFTEASQHDLKSILAEMESQGMVSSVRSLWSANTLYLRPQRLLCSTSQNALTLKPLASTFSTNGFPKARD